MSAPGYIEGIKIPLLDIQEKEIVKAELPLVIDFGSSNTTMGICLPDGTSKIALDKGQTMIPSMIGVKGVLEDRTEFVFGYDALALTGENSGRRCHRVLRYKTLDQRCGPETECHPEKRV
ncbi:hypothetical protein [Enterocloster sp.]|uniref:hypothetical protein n=1 Tax=Enterocloster sp. TaxID=2719315 RepID=UPI0039A1001E